MFDISNSQVTLGKQTIPVAADVDVLVCGGGVAGIADAIAAARNGARTLLIERAGFLGGTATGSAMGLIVIPATELVGFPRELTRRPRHISHCSNPWFEVLRFWIRFRDVVRYRGPRDPRTLVHGSAGFVARSVRAPASRGLHATGETTYLWYWRRFWGSGNA